jgi:hypothetical protein
MPDRLTRAFQRHRVFGAEEQSTNACHFFHMRFYSSSGLIQYLRAIPYGL